MKYIGVHDKIEAPVWGWIASENRGGRSEYYIYVQMHSFRGFDSRKRSLDALQRDSRGVLEIVIKRREWIRMTVVKMGLKYSDGLSRYSSIVEYFGKLSMNIDEDIVRLFKIKFKVDRWTVSKIVKDNIVWMCVVVYTCIIVCFGVIVSCCARDMLF